MSKGKGDPSSHSARVDEWIKRQQDELKTYRRMSSQVGCESEFRDKADA